MKNGFAKIALIIGALLIVLLCVKFIPLGTKKATLGATLITIEVPKLSSLDSECCEYEATFKTFRSLSSVKKDMESIMSKYQKVMCNGSTYYYDSSNNITYKEISYEGGLLNTTYKISYVRNNICDN